jgi:hypothetical protein
MSKYIIDLFEKEGRYLQVRAKDLVLDFMQSKFNEYKKGFRTSDIFNKCGFDWGDYESTKSTQQQYWVVALLRELEHEGKIKRLNNKRWLFLKTPFEL